MHFSVWPNSTRSAAETLDTARWADENNWYGFWYADHYMPNTNDETVKDGSLLECWSVLGAVCATTENILIGPLVSPTSIHHPALLANRAATLDQISNGRFVLGLGAGWQINEHLAYGFGFESPKDRVNRFEEAIQIVRSLLDCERTDFDGEIFQFKNAPCDPKPVQEKLPILVGTAGKRMSRIVARHAQGWNAWGAPALAKKKLKAFHQACEEVGTDPASIHLNAQAICVICEDDQIDDVMKMADPDLTIAGTPSRLIEELSKFAEAGFDEFIVPDFFLGETTEQRREGLEIFQNEVLPAFR